MIAYLDSSALVKLVRSESETDALFAALRSWPDRITSVVARVEMHRALGRVGASRHDVTRAQALLSGVALLRLDDDVIDAAISAVPPTVRSLDAIHLGSALSVGDDLGVFVTYDARQADAARSLGLDVDAPR